MILSRGELRQLIEPVETGVSIYLATERAGDIEQNRIRVKNLLRQAEERLVQNGTRAAIARGITEPAARLLPDINFWQHQSDGLALFLAPGSFRYYRLPYRFPEVVMVLRRFYVKPLIPLMSSDGMFYVLALSVKKVRLMQCTPLTCDTLAPESLPPSLAEALKFEHFDRDLQFRFQKTAPAAMAGELSFSHGEEPEQDRRDELFRYFREVDKGLRGLLHDEQAPLVLAAVDRLHPLYRAANTYSHLFERGIEGNPDETAPRELHRQAWNIIHPHFEQEQKKDEARFLEARSKGLGTNDISEAALAAHDGRVAVLFAALEVRAWGFFQTAEHRIEQHDTELPGDEDLLDFAAAHTLVNSGQVYVTRAEQVPGGAPVAALLRY